MNRKSAAVVSFALGLLVLVALVRGMNWLPTAVRKDLPRRYASIEEAKSGANLGDVLVPAYIPQTLKWPPAAIVAQGKPFPALVMEFERIDRKEVVLVISQSASSALVLDDKIRLDEIKEQARYPLKGRDAILEVGASKAGEPCSRLTWNEGSRKIVVLSRVPPLETIGIAESMIP